MAKYGNVVNKSRLELGSVLPLDFPLSLFIDTCNACNFRCGFCALQTSSEKMHFKKMAMEWETFKKVVDDIYESGKKLKMLRLAGNGEPLMNKLLPQMIRYAKKEKQITEFIEIVSNASLFNHELSDAIVEAGLDRIRISIEAPDKSGYEKMCGKTIDWDNFVNEIGYLFNNKKQLEIYIKTVDAAVPDENSKDLFYETFEGICDKISIEHVIPFWAGFNEIRDSFDIAREGLHGHKYSEVNICPTPFYSCIVNPDGEVTACCSDWRRTIVLGNVKDESFLNIWNGERYRSFLRKMVVEGRKKCHPTCMSCEAPDYDAVDRIDGYEEEMLLRMKELWG